MLRRNSQEHTASLRLSEALVYGPHSECPLHMVGISERPMVQNKGFGIDHNDVARKSGIMFERPAIAMVELTAPIGALGSLTFLHTWLPIAAVQQTVFCHKRRYAACNSCCTAPQPTQQGEVRLVHIRGYLSQVTRDAPP